MEVDEDTLLVTYHPVTLEPNRLPYQVENLIKALNAINKKMIVTYPNSDNGSDYIIKKLQEFAKINSNVHLFKNLGITRYLSVMKLCGAVVGNSSSALVEAPYLKVPVVNIGNRQKGRLMAENIISCSNKYEDVVKAVNKALSSEFRERVKRSKSLYGEGNTSEEIVKVLESIEINDELLKRNLFGVDNMSVLIIAEAGVNHNGDVKIAKELVDMAVECGADAIKFQTFKAEESTGSFAEKAQYQKENDQTEESQLEMIKNLNCPLNSLMEFKVTAMKKHCFHIHPRRYGKLELFSRVECTVN